MRHIRLTPVLLLLACGDGGTTPTTPPTTPTPVATSITLSAASLSFASLGETKQLSAAVKDQNGSAMTGASVSWSTSDASVATVSSAGLVTAAANGTATITVTSGSASSTASATVAQVAASIELIQTELTFTSQGETRQIDFMVKDANDHPISTATVTWSSSDNAVATVSEGLVTAGEIGTATITATSGSASATASVTVQEEASTLPDTEIDSGPATGSTQRESETGFSFFSDQFDTDFECSLDGGAWSACGITSEGDFISKVGYTGLGEGGHTFEVRAVNSIGSDPTPASRTWSVDTTGDSGILKLVSSTTVAGADIWSGLSFDGSHILLTTMINGHINLVKYTTDLVQVGDAVALTTASDLPAGKNIADHKHLLMGSTLFVSWSPSGDKELYLFRTDTDGNRVGPQVAVVEESPVMTNDMHLFTNGESVFVMYAEAGADRYITQYDTTLVAAGPTKKITAPSPHDPLGATLFQNGGYRMFGGNGVNRHLIVANWTSTWSTEEPYERVIVPSTTDDWNWFASGVEWDPTTKRWFVGYRHMESGEDSDTQGKLRLAVFDEKYGLLDRLQIPGLPWFRPHFLLEGGHLYVSYDNQSDEVNLVKYKITP